MKSMAYVCYYHYSPLGARRRRQPQWEKAKNNE
jgi:hypothetical protein